MKKTHEIVGYKYENETEEESHRKTMESMGWSVRDYSIYLHTEYIKFQK